MLQAILVSPTAKLDISSLVQPSPSPSPPPPSTTSLPPFSRSFSVSATETQPRVGTSPTPSTGPAFPSSAIPRGAVNPARHASAGGQAPPPTSATSSKRTASTSPQESRHASKKPTRQWSQADSDELLKLRGSNMKWEDVALHFPGRTPTACRLRYQNYLERRFSWTDEKKTKLARLYDRYKHEMWSSIANELVIPWRAVEDMHWMLGQDEMASRAGARLLHPDRSTGDPAPSGPRMSTILPPPASFVTGPASTFARLPATPGGVLAQPPGPATTNGTGTQRFPPGGEEMGFGFQRRSRRQRSSGGQLPSMADLDSGISAYAAQGEGYDDEDEDEDDMEEDAEQPVRKREL
ncbi:MAG: hypothetical protein Q9201_003938 [Fulgogasparrea decipioides]